MGKVTAPKFTGATWVAEPALTRKPARAVKLDTAAKKDILEILRGLEPGDQVTFITKDGERFPMKMIKE